MIKELFLKLMDIFSFSITKSININSTTLEIYELKLIKKKGKIVDKYLKCRYCQKTKRLYIDIYKEILNNLSNKTDEELKEILAKKPGLQNFVRLVPSLGDLINNISLNNHLFPCEWHKSLKFKYESILFQLKDIELIKINNISK